LLQEERDQFKQLSDERNLTIQELQARYDELVANQEQVLQREAEDESMSFLRAELHRQAAYLRSLESINTKLTAELTILRERHRSVEVLREENRGLTQNIAMSDEPRLRSSNWRLNLKLHDKNARNGASETINRLVASIIFM
jgi:mitotic spindle assembly checkpoint protein MAD1